MTILYEGNWWKVKIKCGTDIIEIDRIKDSIDNIGNSFVNRVYTENEIKYCESKKSKNINTMQQDLQQKKQYLKQYQHYYKINIQSVGKT